MLEQRKELGEVVVEGCSLAVVQAGAAWPGSSSAGSQQAVNDHEQQRAMAAMEANGYCVQFWTLNVGEASTNRVEYSRGHEDGQEWLGEGACPAWRRDSSRAPNSSHPLPIRDVSRGWSQALPPVCTGKVRGKGCELK